MSVVAGTADTQRLQVSAVADPPAQVTVFSAFGGRDTEPVVVVADAAVNRDPVAQPDAVTTAEDTPIAIDVLAANPADTGTADSDPDGDTLTVSGVFGVVNGSITRVGSVVTFTPNPNFVGTGGFSDSIPDGNGGTASAAVTVGVTAVNDPPRITSNAVTVASVGVAYSYDVNATDPDAGTVLTYALTQFPAGMTINATTGLIQWTPAAVGNQVVTVQVTDNGAPQLSASQTFTIAVAGAIDYDIASFPVNGQRRVGQLLTPVVRVRNAATGQQLRTARVTGTRNGVQLYNRTLQVSAAPGQTVPVSFPSYRPTQTGTIIWRATIADDNPDVDFRRTDTVINP
jgi:hypothetical protein